MPDVSGLMRGKRGLVMGVANHRSLGWGIAKACRSHGAELAFTYQGEALKKRVEPLAQEIGGVVVGDDVSWNASLWDFADEFGVPAYNFKGAVGVAFC